MEPINTQSIAVAVADRISKIAPAVTDKVIEHLVNKELMRRSEAVINGMSELDKLKNEARKMKPDMISYNLDGSIASSTWSKAKLDEKNKADQKIEKITKAIDKALTDNDYSDLYNVSKAPAPVTEL
jgi:hypothetical protein